MKTKDLLAKINNTVKSETIVKLLLCYYNNIGENLNKIPNMERKDLSYMDEYINDRLINVKQSTNRRGNLINHHPDVGVSKHFLIKDLLKNKHPYTKIENYIFPDYIKSNFSHAIDGPYLSSRYILFYDEIKKIGLVFTANGITTSTGNISDFNLRELNSYILDNFYRSDFDDLISSRTSFKLDYIKDIISHSSISSKIGIVNNQSVILRIIKEKIYSRDNNIHPFYKWEIIQKEPLHKQPNEKEV